MTEEKNINAHLCANYENILAGNGEYSLRQMLMFVLNAMMESEANAKTGAKKG